MSEMKFKVCIPYFEGRNYPVSRWTEIDAIDEQEAAEKYAEQEDEEPSENEFLDVWVYSDRLHKFKVGYVISYDFYADEIEEL